MSPLLLAAVLFQVDGDLPPLGTNLAGVSDWTTQWAFVDAFKLSRPWVSQKEGAEWGKGEPLDVDATGNVRSLKPGQFAETVIFSKGKNPHGTYTLLWEGDGDFEAHLGSNLKNATKGRAEVEVNGDNGIYLMLKRVDPKNPPQNIRLIMPGYEETYREEPFHPVFMQRMSLYRCLRFMDWGATNESTQKEWVDRATTGQVTNSIPKGVPLETMIDLANRKMAMPWFCVPHMASDDYVRQMAKLIKEQLKPELKVAVEYSNECWNQGFGQAKWCIEQGKKLKLSDKDAEAGLRYYSQRSVEVFAIFKDVFGDTSRLVRILSAQAAVPTTAETVLNWKNAYRNADALAIAPYFGYGLGSPDANLKDLDDLFSQLKTEVSGPLRDRMFEYATLAQQNRLKLVAYEGGQHLVGLGAKQDEDVLNQMFDEANRDLRMGDTYSAMLKAWRTAGGTLFMHFTDCGAFSKYGRWGTIEYQNEDPQRSYKNRALIQYALFPDR